MFKFQHQYVHFFLHLLNGHFLLTLLTEKIYSNIFNQ